MASWGSGSYLYSPIMALVGIGLLMLVLRWASRRGTSVVERPILPSEPTDYGMLSAVASPATYIEAELARRHLESEGIKATVAMTNDGPRVMVWPGDEAGARRLLTRR